MEQRGGAAVGELPGELGGGEARVERHEDGPEARRGVDDGGVGGAVARQNGDAITLGNAEGGELRGELVRPGVERGEGVCLVARDDGGARGVERGAAGEPVGELHSAVRRLRR